MSGNVHGGLQAKQTIIENHGADFWKRIGAEGGKKGTNGGFGAGAAGKERARIWGAVGGSMSRRGSATKLTEEERLQKKLEAIRREYDRTREIKLKAERLRRREMLEQAREKSEMQVSALSEKYGAAKKW